MQSLRAKINFAGEPFLGSEVAINVAELGVRCGLGIVREESECNQEKQCDALAVKSSFAFLILVRAPIPMPIRREKYSQSTAQSK